MRQIASSGQLRAGLLRWALWMVPLVLLLGFLSGQAARGGAGNAWFDALVKPSLFPPPATFGIVWAVLYVMMGVAAAMIGAARGAPGRTAALIAFALQLAINLAWSPTFFAAHQITAALAVIGALAVAVIVTTGLFWKVRPLAGALLLPYLAWVLFAALLNWQFLAANPAADGQDAGGAVSRVAI